ncbi:MAG: hypothetical protein WCK67_06010 [bacterium]
MSFGVGVQPPGLLDGQGMLPHMDAISSGNSNSYMDKLIQSFFGSDSNDSVTTFV